MTPDDLFHFMVGISFGIVFITGLELIAPGYPTIEFVKHIDGLNGYYDGAYNHIQIATEGQFPYYTTLHEYAHYVYLNRLSGEERKIWDGKLCNHEYPDYDAMYETREEKCKEHFAISMSHYILQEGWHYTMLRDMNHTQDVFYFVADMYEKYW